MNPEDQIKPLPLTPEQQVEAFSAVAAQRKALDDEFEVAKREDVERGRETENQEDDPFNGDTRVAVDIALQLETLKSIDQKLDGIVSVLERIATGLEGREE